MTTRYNIGDFNIANPVYAGATVSFYTVSGGAKTTTLATLYAASTGTTQGSNPATLDSVGKLSAPLYVEVPVIATISGLGSVSDHDTGIMGLAEGAASTSAAAAAASAAAALVSENNAETAETNAETAQAAAEAAAAGVGMRGAATVGGTVDAITATFSPAFASLAASAGIVLAIPLAGANATTTPTLAIDGLTAKVIVKGSGTALVAGDIPGADFVGLFVYDVSLDKFQMINPHGVMTTFGGKSFLDEDDMASNSATAVPSQQSVKAYADASSRVVQVVEASTTAIKTINSSIPVDNTKPQNTEGVEILTVSVTPTNAANFLHIDFDATVFSHTSAAYFAVALFVDSDADAIAVGQGVYSAVPNVPLNSAPDLHHRLTAGSTSARTYKIRMGATVGTAYVNADHTGTGLFGGLATARLRVTEIKA